MRLAGNRRKEGTMNTREKLKELCDYGFTIKAISKLSQIRTSTLYQFSAGNTDLSEDKQKRLLDTIEVLKGVVK